MCCSKLALFLHDARLVYDVIRGLRVLGRSAGVPLRLEVDENTIRIHVYIYIYIYMYTHIYDMTYYIII